MTDSPDVVLRGSFDRSHEKRYVHVPFDVPPGVRALHVRYDYSERIPSDPLLSGGNTLDIGLFGHRDLGHTPVPGRPDPGRPVACIARPLQSWSTRLPV